MLSPDCEECASSAMTAKRLPGSWPISSAMTGELLQRRDDDRPAAFQGLAELAGRVLDVLDHAEGLLELPDGALELAVEHAAVGHHDHGVEHAPVFVVVQHRELVGEPGDGVALAAAGGVLDEVALAGAVVARVAHQPAHAVELLVAREDQEPLAGPAAALVCLDHFVDELANEVEDAVAGPDPLPQVVGRIAVAGGRQRRIPGAAAVAAVERQEPRLRPGKLGGDEDLLRVDREVGEATAVGEERFARVAVVLVLPDGVSRVLALQRALEFRREDGDAVQEDPEVDALAGGPFAEVELPRDREEVGPVQALEFLVQPARRLEVREAELAARVPDSVSQHVERAPAANLAREPPEEARLDVRAVVLPELRPLRRLRGEEEVEHVGRDQAEAAVVVVVAALVVAAGQWVVAEGGGGLAKFAGVLRVGVGAAAEEGALDGLLEVAFGGVGGHAGAVLERLACLGVAEGATRAGRGSMSQLGVTACRSSVSQLVAARCHSSS